MRRHPRIILAALLAILVAGTPGQPVFAAPLAHRVQAEIDGLLSRLVTSGCEFNRNGTWYSAVEAKSHLQRKLKYLEDRGLVDSAEQFIERAASGSSMSGKPYLVRCGDAAPVTSGAWLRSQLQALRTAAPAQRAP
jgi:hypothetical protein